MIFLQQLGHSELPMTRVKLNKYDQSQGLDFFKDTEFIRQQIALKHRYRIRKHYNNNRQHKDKKQHDSRN